MVSAETVKQILPFAITIGDAEFAALVRFLGLTSCRPSEAEGLTPDAVHWAERCAVLAERKTAHRGKGAGDSPFG